jgi:hypothetical protein
MRYANWNGNRNFLLLFAVIIMVPCPWLKILSFIKGLNILMCIFILFGNDMRINCLSWNIFLQTKMWRIYLQRDWIRASMLYFLVLFTVAHEGMSWNSMLSTFHSIGGFSFVIMSHGFWLLLSLVFISHVFLLLIRLWFTMFCVTFL